MENFRILGAILFSTIFALGDVAALVASLVVDGVAPRTDPVPVRVPAVVQLQTVVR